ncbi:MULTISPECIES: YbaB/EbfC family nucleoid-associated protein [Rhodococcus]|uniref:YbaB/EbfC family nucleoid-associated protein n=1 Tax=Rhodococcus TaxID=1827 RepID=UPI000BE271AA|nr:YbaB/EbfC family nucleoid-associated protein [Rhodococcus sp. H-CA8f]ATI30640.1 hypothetical protein CPI83_00330 [Rhodococcus sp. H-CA8f]
MTANSFDDIGVKVRRAQEALDRVVGRASDRAVEVEVDAKGHLGRLRLTDAALAAGPDLLADRIVQMYTAAVRDARPQVDAALAEVTSDPQMSAITSFVDQVTPAGEAPTPVAPTSEHDPPAWGDSPLLRPAMTSRPRAQFW